MAHSNKKYLSLSLIIIWSVLATCMGVLILAAFWWPIDLRGVESNVLHIIQLIHTDRSSLYSNPEKIPFNITQYTPFYYILSNEIWHLLPDSVSLIILTRTISLVGFILVLSFVYKILKKIATPINFNILALASIAIFTFPWYQLARPDAFECAFIFGALYLYLFPPLKNQIGNILLLSLSVAGAIFSKQGSTIFIVAFFIFYLMEKEWKKGLFFLASTFLLLALFFYGIDLLGYDISFIIQNIIMGIDNGIDITRAIEITYSKYISYFFFFTLTLIIFYLLYFNQHSKNSIERKLFYLNLFVFFISFILALKAGSAINYFNVSIILQVILLSAIFAKSSQNLRKASEYLILAAGISVSLQLLVLYIPRIKYLSNKNQANQKSIENIVHFLSDHPEHKYFYTEERNVALSLPNRTAFYSMDIHNLNFERNVYNYEQMISSFKKGEIYYLIINKANTNKTLFNFKINEFYDILFEAGDNLIYAFKKENSTNLNK